MFRSLLTGLLFSLAAGFLAAQLPQHFEGLERSKVTYLSTHVAPLATVAGDSTLRLHLPPGHQLNDVLREVRQDLRNLPTVTDATYAIDSLNGQPAAVRWTIDEGRSRFPLLNVGGVRGNFNYLVGINDINFRGRGQELTAFYRNNDGEHNYYLRLRNPHYRGGRWGYALESRRYAAVEPVYFASGPVAYRYANLSFGLEGSYTTPDHHVFTLGLSNFYERYRLADPTAETPGPRALNLTKGLVKASHRSGRLDYHHERLAGSDHLTQLQFVRNLNDGAGFAIGWHDFRHYRLVGRRGNLAVRLRAGVSTNEDSPFAPFVLDSQVNIRGSGNRIDRGTAQLILNVEYRHRVWADSRQRFATQVVAFSDGGTWRNPGGDLSELVQGNNVRHFVGAGVRLISLKAFNALIRVDYGVDVRNTRERGLVVGFGQYF